MNKEEMKLLPVKLTAENGAKAALIGEFHEDFGYIDDGGNEHYIKVPVNWTTIEQIWDAAVAHFDRHPIAALRASAAPDRMTMMVECSSGEAFPTALSPDSRKAEPVAARLNQIADNIGGSHAPELRQLAAALAPATEDGGRETLLALADIWSAEAKQSDRQKAIRSGVHLCRMRKATSCRPLPLPISGDTRDAIGSGKDPMSYESPEYCAIKRNVTRTQTMLRHVDNARTFNHLRYAESLTLTGKGRFEDRPTTITVSSDLMTAILDLCAQRSIDAAKAIHCGEWEANKFEEAAKV